MQVSSTPPLAWRPLCTLLIEPLIPRCHSTGLSGTPLVTWRSCATSCALRRLSTPPCAGVSACPVYNAVRLHARLLRCAPRHFLRAVWLLRAAGRLSAPYGRARGAAPPYNAQLHVGARTPLR
jgi:hypothetical protein